MSSAHAPRNEIPPAPERARLTLKVLADALGVSRTTISNAYNRPERLSDELRATVFAKARELGYFGPDPMARALRRRELQTVGIVFHHDMLYALSDATTVAFLGGIAEELDRRRLWMQFIPKMGRSMVAGSAFPFQSTADAMIVHSEVAPEFMHEVTATPKPLVLVDSQVPGIASVCTDDRRGARLAMQHALAARPDAVLVLSFRAHDAAGGAASGAAARTRAAPLRSHVTRERLAGYRQAARSARFAAERLCRVEVDDEEPESAGRAVAGMRARVAGAARLAVVAMSDRLALAAAGEISRWNECLLVATVGFDDIPAAAVAQLTTIRQDSRAKGEAAVKVLLDGQGSTTMPVELVVRAT